METVLVRDPLSLLKGSEVDKRLNLYTMDLNKIAAVAVEKGIMQFTFRVEERDASLVETLVHRITNAGYVFVQSNMRGAFIDIVFKFPIF